MKTRNLQLWYAHPGDLIDPTVAEACADLLSEQEQERWQRFRYETNRRESLTSRALARLALSHAHSLPPHQWDFVVNHHGKPHPVPDCGLRFNLSNSADLVVCAVAQGAEVGVDVEPHTRAPQILHLAHDIFSPSELGQLMAVDSEERLERVLTLWTLKEAYIKARGMGLALPLKRVSFLFSNDVGIEMELESVLNDNPANWQFCLLDHAGHRIALMVEASQHWHLQVLEARPPLAPPVELHEAVLGWFPRA